MTVEEVPDDEGRVIGGTTLGGGILEDTRDDRIEEDEQRSWSESDQVEAESPPLTEEEEAPPLCVLKANRALRRKWLKQGVIQDVGEQVWIAAGYTYSQQLAEAAQKHKPKKTFEQMVPPQYRQFSKVFSE